VQYDFGLPHRSTGGCLDPRDPLEKEVRTDGTTLPLPPPRMGAHG